MTRGVVHTCPQASRVDLTDWGDEDLEACLHLSVVARSHSALDVGADR